MISLLEAYWVHH